MALRSRGPGGPGGPGGPPEPSVNDHLRAEYAAAGQAVDTFRIGGDAARHVAAYLEYERIVGSDDGGRPMSEAEYAAYRVRAQQMRADRIYITWRCGATGMDCKNAGPATKCFCGHMLKQHTTDNVMGQQKHAKDVHCKEAGCRCELFEYMPGHGTWSIKCGCKHEASPDHDPRTKRCRTAKTCGCVGFFSSFSCSCGRSWSEHTTAFETREERLAAGRPVENLGGGGQEYAALGGITDMSSLVDGVERIQAALPFSKAVDRIQRGEPLPPAAARQLMAHARSFGPAGGAGAAALGRASGGPALAIAGRSASLRGGADGGAGPSSGPPRALSAAEQYAANKRDALARANALRAERQRVADAAGGPLSELEQLDRAFDKRNRR